MENLEITHKVEITHLNNKVELLYKKIQTLEAKLNNTVSASEYSTSGSVKGLEPTANEGTSKLNKGIYSEGK